LTTGIRLPFALDNGISFDFNQPVSVNKANNLHDRVCGPNATKKLAVDCRDLLPIRK
jgi:hypothetical protein